MQSSLIKTSPFLKEIFNVMSEGILIIDTDEIIQFCNTRYLDFIHLPAEKVIGQKLRLLRPNARLPEAVAAGKEILHAQRLEGLEEAYFVNMYPLFEQGQIVGGLSVITFMNDANKARQELENYEKHSIQLMRHVSKQTTTYTFDNIIAAAPETVRLKNFAKKLAEGDVTVLLQSESGTGKELYAQSIHNASPRSNNVFLAVNCANFSGTMLDSELFGYTDGAFTGAKKGGKIGLFEAAKGGTLFLDEISEMDITLQAKLLRALQEKKIRPVGGLKEIDIDVRIICASNANLPEYVTLGKFRKDLYYRLNTFVISIPPLRERREDIAPIVSELLKLMSHKQRRKIDISDEAIAALTAYDWPGNVRELRNVVEFSAYLCEQETIVLSSLPDNILRPRGSEDAQPPLSERVKAFEHAEVKRAVSLCGNTLEGKKAAAKMLNISLASLYNKLKE